MKFKYLILTLISSFIGIIGAPEFLMADNAVSTISDLNPANIVETVIPEPEPEPEPEPAPEPVYYSYVAYAPAAPAPAPVVYAPANHLDIAGRSLTVEYTPSTAVNAGDVVKFYNNKFLYGHNTGNVFGFLPSVGVGTVFSLTYEGVTTNYQVMEKVEYAKASPTSLSLNGQEVAMSFIAKGKNIYNLTLMTCSGVSYGNGDASHRLVLFANAI